MNRLETLAPEILNLLKVALPQQRVAAVLIACEKAITHANVESSVVNDALSIIKQGGKLTKDFENSLKKIADRFDDDYLLLQESGGSEKDVLNLFGKARAVSSLIFSANVGSIDDSAEAIYEAAAAFDDPTSLFEVVKARLLINVE